MQAYLLQPGQIPQPMQEGDFTFAHEGFPLESGASLQPVTLHYAIYGQLNERRDNAVLVCHALSGSAAVGEWWPMLFEGFSAKVRGLVDLSRDCVIGINILGSCYGSTGPASIDAKTGKPYGADFPLVSIGDIVRSQAHLLDHLGIERLKLVMGASIGCMQALQWAIDYPERVTECIGIGAAQLGPMGLAMNHMQRQAIRLDPKWQGGGYTPDSEPTGGLALARAMATCTYKSSELFEERFGRKPNRTGEDPWKNSSHPRDVRFDVAGFLDYQGEKFNQRFDANSYLAITRMMDTFDPGRKYGSFALAFQRIQAKVRLVGISSDWLFPPQDVRRLAEKICLAGAACDYLEMQSDHGHDAFLAEPEKLVLLLNGAARR
ncbi:MAG: homoserine O-acetyltransferase MetX [Acidobacteriaceae bacterium]